MQARVERRKLVKNLAVALEDNEYQKSMIVRIAETAQKQEKQIAQNLDDLGDKAFQLTIEGEELDPLFVQLEKAKNAEIEKVMKQIEQVQSDQKAIEVQSKERNIGNLI